MITNEPHSSYVREGLEQQLRTLEEADPNLCACIVCYQLEGDCTCGGRSVLWPLLQVVFRLRTVLNDDNE